MKNYNKTLKILIIILLVAVIFNVEIRRNECLLEDGLYKFEKEIKSKNHNYDVSFTVYGDIKDNKISSIDSGQILTFGKAFAGTIDLNLTSDFNILYFVEGKIYEKDPYLNSQPTEVLIKENNRKIWKYELPKDISLSFYDSISEIGTVSREDLKLEEVFNPLLAFTNILIGLLGGYLILATLFYRSYKRGNIYGKYRLKAFNKGVLVIFVVTLLWDFINKSNSSVLSEFIKVIVIGIVTTLMVNFKIEDLKKYKKTKTSRIIEKSFMGITLVLTLFILINCGKYLSEVGFNRYGRSNLSETTEYYNWKSTIENYKTIKHSYKPGYPENLENIVEINIFSQDDKIYEYPELILIKDSPVSLLPIGSNDLKVGNEVKITFGKLKTEKPEYNKKLTTWVLKDGEYLYKYETNEKMGDLEFKIEEDGDYAFLFINQGEETLTLESGKIEINKSDKSSRSMESRFNL